MALITIPKTLPVPSDIPLATHNIGRFASVRNWWTLNSEAFSGLTLNPRKGSVGLTASDALLTEEAYGYTFPRGDGTTGAYIESLFTPPSRLFSIVSIQRMDTGATEPWGIGFDGSVTGGFRLRPAFRATNGNVGYGMFGPGLNEIGTFTSPSAPGAPLGVPSVCAMVFDLTSADAGGPSITLKGTADGGVNWGSATIIPSQPQSVASEMMLRVMQANPSEPFDGPVMDVAVIDGDLTTQPDLLAAINSYADSAFINYGA